MTTTDAELVARQLGAKVREARLARSLTLAALSDTTALSPGFLSRLERGETNASISNLIAISSALRVQLRDLFDGDNGNARPEYVLTRAKVRSRKAPLAARGYTWNRSSGDLAGQQMSAFELTYPPGGKVHPRLVEHEGEEVLFLLEGTLEFVIGSDTFVMNPGDCVHFNCEQPHRGRNIGKVAARLLMVVTPRRSLQFG